MLWQTELNQKCVIFLIWKVFDQKNEFFPKFETQVHSGLTVSISMHFILVTLSHIVTRLHSNKQSSGYSSDALYS